MFNKLMQMLGDSPEDMEMMPEDEISVDEPIDQNEAEAILNDPTSDYQMKTMAMQMIKDRYLKPREE